MASKINLNNYSINSSENLLKNIVSVEDESKVDSLIDIEAENMFWLRAEFAFPFKNNEGKMTGIFRRIYNTKFYPAFKESEFERLTDRAYPLEMIQKPDGTPVNLIASETFMSYEDHCFVSKESVMEIRTKIEEDGSLGEESKQEVELWRTLLPSFLPIPVSDDTKLGVKGLDYDFGFANKKTILSGDGILRLEDGRIIRIIRADDIDARLKQIANTWMTGFARSAKLYIVALMNQILMVNYEVYKNGIADLSQEDLERFHSFEEGCYGGQER